MGNLQCTETNDANHSNDCNTLDLFVESATDQPLTITLKSFKDIVSTYLNCHRIYTTKYGPKTVIFIRVGSFYEAYATNTHGPDLFEIIKLLNIVCTKKDRTNSEVSESNPYMAGFSCLALHRYAQQLVEAGYTVIVMDPIDRVVGDPAITYRVVSIFEPDYVLIDNTTNHISHTMTSQPILLSDTIIHADN